MDRGAWWVAVHPVAESDRTERLTVLLLSIISKVLVPSPCSAVVCSAATGGGGFGGWRGRCWGGRRGGLLLARPCPGQLCRQLDEKQPQRQGLSADGSTGNTQPGSPLRRTKLPPATRSGYHTDMLTRAISPFWRLRYRPRLSHGVRSVWNTVEGKERQDRAVSYQLCKRRTAIPEGILHS